MIGVFVIGFALRAGWGVSRMVRSDSGLNLEFPDEGVYWAMAGAFRQGKGLPDELGFQATRMPLYPALLSLFTGVERGLIGARVLQWFVGALAASLTAALGAKLFDWRVGLWSGPLVAADPFLIFFSSLLLTETFFVTAAAALWLAASWAFTTPATQTDAPIRRWLVLALCSSLCVYVRESSLGLIALLLILVAVSRPSSWKKLAGSGLTLCLIILALLPWAHRNRVVIGESCWLTTRSGISLYDGVRPNATGGSDLAHVKQMPEVVGLSEVEWNRYFLTESYKIIKTDPRRLIRLIPTKLARIWNPLPNVETYRSWGVRAVSAGWTIPTFALTILGLTLMAASRGSGDWRIALFLVLPVIYLTLLHSVFVGSVRYRLGALPMMAVAAAYAICRIYDRFSSTRYIRSWTVDE